MQKKFEWYFRALLICLLIAIGVSLFAGAQTTNNNAGATVTNSVPNPGKVEKGDERYLTFNLDEIKPLREFSILGQPLWKYIASLIYVALAFLVAKVLDWITRVGLRKLTARTETKLDDLLLDLLHGPIKVIAFVVFLHIGLNIFKWPANAASYL